MQDTDVQRQRALVLALLITLVLWNLPIGGVVLYPFKLFATWLHELSHGLVMLFTGAGFERMEIFRDTSGLAHPRHGVSALGSAAIAAAGYMGAPLFGAVFLVLGQTARGARWVLAAIGGLLTVTGLAFVRNDFGGVAVGVGSAAFLAIAAFASHRLTVFVVNFVAAQACINAVLDIRVLFRSNLVVNGNVISSDAHNMAQASFGNPWMWASLWLVWSFLVCFVALKIVYLRHQQWAVDSPHAGRHTTSVPAPSASLPS